VGFDGSKRYGLAVLIHGGPQGSFKDGWLYRWNMQLYAAHGYATLVINFHGSNSFGHQFCLSISKGIVDCT
jgi:dipeptidyl aminopeptidase/acylaminoacyl peptidase